MSRIRAQRPGADVREHLAREHEQTALKWALWLGADDLAERARRWIERVRAGDPVTVAWYRLPEGTLPLGAHDPNDYVIVLADGAVQWAGL